MPVSTHLRGGIWEAGRGFRLVGTGLQLQADTSSFHSSPSHLIEKIPLRTDFLV
jgi:hypothetical protein